MRRLTGSLIGFASAAARNRAAAAWVSIRSQLTHGSITKDRGRCYDQHADPGAGRPPWPDSVWQRRSVCRQDIAERIGVELHVELERLAGRLPLADRGDRQHGIASPITSGRVD